MYSDQDAYLLFKAQKGLQQKGLWDNKEYQDRIFFEWETICKMGFSGYYLVVSDYCLWARNNGVPVGPGRGSGAGSLVAYAVGITDIDSIKYDLFFERFLNPSRVSMPDFDIDFGQRDRSKVIQYCIDKYGEDKVCQIGTNGTVKSKLAIKDVGRTMGVEYSLLEKYSSHVPDEARGGQGDHAVTLELCLNPTPEFEKSYGNDLAKFTQLYNSDKVFYDIVNAAVEIEGVPKSIGVHPAGIIISNDMIANQIPLRKSKQGYPVSQWTDKQVEAMAFVKFDFLGLRTLDVIDGALKSIERRTGLKIDWEEIDDSDPKTYEMLSSGDTFGIFQLESSGISGFTKEFKPNSIEEISTISALYRPGPLDCLTSEVPILTSILDSSSGSGRQYFYKTVGELYEKQHNGTNRSRNPLWIMSLNPDTHTLVKNKILDVQKTGKKEVFSIDLQLRIDGKAIKDNQRKLSQLKASAGHKFWTIRRNEKNPTWCELKDIKPGDYVSILRKGLGHSKGTIGNKNFRNICFYNYQYKCTHCEWNQGSLDVNHLIGNRWTDNSFMNLNFFCPNHHRMFTEGNISLEEVRYQRSLFSLPFTKDLMFAKVTSINSLGIEETYDISVNKPYHSFVAADFVVHNSGMVSKILKIRSGKEEVSYSHSDLREILESTDGVLTYQEQTLAIARKIAGYSLAEADLLRRAIGKKLPEEMAKQENGFKSNAIKLGYNLSFINDLWEMVKRFSDYGFNRSHSISYSFLTFRTAYLKAHYPSDFFASELTSYEGEIKKILPAINDAKKHGINILLPDVNTSLEEYVATDDTNIRIGLSGIKGLGDSAISKLLEIRKDGPYKDLKDLCRRVDSSVKVNNLQALASSGALLEIESDLNRLELFEYIPLLIDGLKSRKNLDRIGQLTFIDCLEDPKEAGFDDLDIHTPVLALSREKELEMEKESLGIYISGSPLDKYEVIREYTHVDDIAICSVDEEDENYSEEGLTGLYVTFLCMISEATVKMGKKGPFAFLGLQDSSGIIAGKVWSNTFQKYSGSIEVGNCVVVRGKINFYRGYEINIDSIILADDELKRIRPRVVINKLNFEILNKIMRLSSGNIPIDLEINNGRIVHRLGLFDVPINYFEDT